MTAGMPPEKLQGQLAHVTDACRGLLESGNSRRWEVFAKSSLTRETELVDGRLRRTVQVEESGIGVRV